MSKKLSATDFICEGKKEGCFKPCKLHNEAGETFKPKEMGCVFMYKHPEWRRVEIEEKQKVECPEVITNENLVLKEIPDGYIEIIEGKIKHGDILRISDGQLQWAWGTVGLESQLFPNIEVYRKMLDKKGGKCET